MCPRASSSAHISPRRGRATAISLVGKRALAWQLCSDPQVIAYRDLGEPEADDPDQPGVVDVSFDMLTDGSSDQTIPSGWYGSGLTVERTSHGWRVSDDGVA